MGLKGAAARAKGQRGERELFALLSDLLGFVVRRKASNRKGEPDGIDIPGWAVEVKRSEQPKLTEWWRQTETQAAAIGRRPVLFFRGNRQPWRAMVDLGDLNSDFENGRYSTVMPVEAASQLIRSQLVEKQGEIDGNR
jgi:hypothetical protein